MLDWRKPYFALQRLDVLPTRVGSTPKLLMLGADSRDDSGARLRERFGERDRFCLMPRLE